MQYFDSNGNLRIKYAKLLLDMGWHAFGDDAPRLFKKNFANLNSESVSVLEFEGEAFIDEGNPEGKVIFIEVGYSAHSVWDWGRDEADRVAEMMRGMIRESAY